MRALSSSSFMNLPHLTISLLSRIAIACASLSFLAPRSAAAAARFLLSSPPTPAPASTSSLSRSSLDWAFTPVKLLCWCHYVLICVYRIFNIIDLLTLTNQIPCLLFLYCGLTNFIFSTDGIYYRNKNEIIMVQMLFPLCTVPCLCWQGYKPVPAFF